MGPGKCCKVCTFLQFVHQVLCTAAYDFCILAKGGEENMTQRTAFRLNEGILDDFVVTKGIFIAHAAVRLNNALEEMDILQPCR